MEEIKTLRKRLLDELEDDYQATFDEYINSGLCFGNSKEEMDGTMSVVCDYIWDAIQASIDSDSPAFDRASAKLMDLAIRGMEAHHVVRNKSS